MKPWPILFFKLTFSFLAAISPASYGAACCGGGFSAPALISGDDRAQWTTSYSFTEVRIDNVDAQGFWRRSSEHQTIQTFRMDAAHIFWDRFQGGMSLPILQRSYLDQNESGLGDVALSLGYEYLPDWDYHPLRPKGIGFLQLVMPTGKSRAESELGGWDSRGNGFWALGAGTLHTKAFGKWDGFLNFEAHRSFGKNIHTSQVKGSLHPGWGGNLGVGFGYNWKFWRLGPSVTWTYEDPVVLKGESPSKGAAERYATSSLALSHMHTEEWATTISYLDQTLFGNPINTSLGRSLMLQIQKRWPR